MRQGVDGTAKGTIIKLHEGTNTASAAYVRFAAVDYTESLAGNGLAVAVVAVRVDAVDVLRQLVTNIAVGKFAIVVILAIDPYGKDRVGQGGPRRGWRGWKS